jgi:hypothetical protein
MAESTKPKKTTYENVKQGVEQIYPAEHETELNAKTNLEYESPMNVRTVANSAFSVLSSYQDWVPNRTRAGSLQKLTGTGHLTSTD